MVLSTLPALSFSWYFFIIIAVEFYLPTPKEKKNPVLLLAILIIKFLFLVGLL